MSVIDRLWPQPAAGIPLDEAFADLSLPASPNGRPIVATNMVTSIDGRAQLSGTAEGLGSREDRRLMRLYRAGFDAVGSGVGTLRADDFYSRLPADLAQRRSAAGRPPQPVAILIGGTSAIPTDRRWFTYQDQPRIVVVGADSPHATDQPLPGVETWVAPTAVPQPAWVLERLAARGVRSLLLEGGPTTNSAFLAARALDELYWTIGPRIVARDALRMIASLDEGEMPKPVEATLVSVHRSGDELFVRYRLGSIGP
ncbi:MAG TPA: RibD family protein [Candidatus Limnocylindria bacterium]|nr:RibD family protein [Candidatus Limnocylindria bacterium]